MKSSTRAILLLSGFLVISDISFVAINYRSSRRALDAQAQRMGDVARKTYQQTFNLTVRSMQMIATYVSRDESVIDLFDQGRKAVVREGGGPGGAEAADIRNQLYDLVSDGWKSMTQRFDVRQLHFHLGPGSTSFLRVHKPGKFGDNMDDVRYTIVHVNQGDTLVGGFETGRVYSGIRGVVPMIIPATEGRPAKRIGALEAGTSYEGILNELAVELDAELAVLLNRDHVESRIWEDYWATLFPDGPLFQGHYLEASTFKSPHGLLLEPEVEEVIGSQSTHRITYDERQFAVTATPLRDFLGTLDPSLPDAGVVLIAQDFTNEYAQFEAGVRTNIIYSILGFLIAELLIVVGVRQLSSSLQKIIDDRTRQLNTALDELKASRERDLAWERVQTTNKLSATIAHEFNSPLAVIKGTCDLQRMLPNLREEDNQRLMVIDRQVEKLKRLVRQLLNLQDFRELAYPGNEAIFDLSDRVDPPEEQPDQQDNERNDPSSS